LLKKPISIINPLDEKSTTMKNKIQTFEKELNSIIGICDEKIKRYRALLEEYQMIKGSALSLLQLNNNTKRKVVSLIDALKSLKYRLYSLMESENED
jgi:hypothetical protein